MKVRLLKAEMPFINFIAGVLGFGITLAALLAALAIVTPAHAGTGMPLMKGFKSPTELATLVDKSLKSDPTGTQVLSPARCKATGSCATAQDYFAGIRSAHPSANLEQITELPRYLRSLVPKPAPAGEWQVSRLLVKGQSHQYDATGWHRAFFKGEAVWFDVNTGEPILAGDCGNVVGKLFAPQKLAPAPAEKCVELAFNAPVGGHVRWGVGTKDGPLPPSACNAQRQDGGAWTSWLDQCDWCNPSIGYIRTVLGSREATVPHKFKYPVTDQTQTLRFSSAILSRVVYICIEYVDGVQTCGVYMRPQDWQGRSRVDIPDDLWVKDNGNCPQ